MLSLFSTMLERDNFSWNFVIKALSSHERRAMALRFAKDMEAQGCLVDRYTFASILGAVVQRSDVRVGLLLHACFHGNGICEDSAVCTALITMYGNCGQFGFARGIFDCMKSYDIIVWTAMIAASSQCGHGKDVFGLFHCMMLRGFTPDVITYVSMLDACSGYSPSLLQCKILHIYVLSCGFDTNVVVGSALINLYGKSSFLLEAKRAFHGMNEQNIVAWNALIGSFSRNGKSQDALQTVDQMAQEGTLPNNVTFVTAIDASMCSIATAKRIHACVEGERTFDGSIVVETALINMYGQCGELARACKLFENMLAHDEVAFISILSACGSCRALAEGKYLHSYAIVTAIECQVVLVTSLINMFSKCGSLEDAQRVFDRMPERNLISWNAIIAAYCQNGMGRQSLILYEQMHSENTMPDDVTFLSILSACSHAGLLEEGLQIFNSMRHDYHIIPNVDQCNCMIDLFGRTGRLKEAEDLILNMPVEPSIASWTTLLSACRKEVDVSRGERAAYRLFTINPQDVVPYVMLANLYAAAGRGNDAEHVMTLMRGKDLRRQSGMPSMFLENDKAQPQTEEMYAHPLELSFSIA